jgi:hypothetical protein
MKGRIAPFGRFGRTEFPDKEGTSNPSPLWGSSAGVDFAAVKAQVIQTITTSYQTPRIEVQL